MSNSRIQQGIAREHPEWIIPRHCQQHAYKSGIYAAIIVGLLTVPITRRFGLDKNKTTFTALGTSSVGGYVVSKYLYKECRIMYGDDVPTSSSDNKAV
ncbi:hypothetical protein VTP01DRAFT_8026 [Rhizomucor pusillus]|uniref:uncharacterized protein n=1 Tax=Rhizomucor pusillus TaxID=4840 RepID=UPI0037433908